MASTKAPAARLRSPSAGPAAWLVSMREGDLTGARPGTDAEYFAGYSIFADDEIRWSQPAGRRTVCINDADDHLAFTCLRVRDLGACAKQKHDG